MEVTYTAPEERRHLGDDVVDVVLWVVEVGRDEAVGATLALAIKRAIDKVRTRYPGMRAEVDDDDQ